MMKNNRRTTLGPLSSNTLSSNGSIGTESRSRQSMGASRIQREEKKAPKNRMSIATMNTRDNSTSIGMRKSSMSMSRFLLLLFVSGLKLFSTFEI